MNIFQTATKLDKNIIAPVINSGDLVVDATCGNGHDTVFLAHRVGEQGEVYAFDIQERAVQTTYERLSQENLDKRVNLFKESHANMRDYVDGRHVKGIMFNLGYLPGGDKGIVTTPTETINGLTAGFELLQAGGILTCVVYPGHDTGKFEAKEVENHLGSLSQDHGTVMKLSPVNQQNNPPYVIAILKRKEL